MPGSVCTALCRTCITPLFLPAGPHPISGAVAQEFTCVEFVASTFGTPLTTWNPAMGGFSAPIVMTLDVHADPLTQVWRGTVVLDHRAPLPACRVTYAAVMTPIPS